MASVIYIADPMCSWCYGFGPELSALLDGLPGLPLHIVVGGLRAHNKQVMDEKLKTMLLTHWAHVHQRTGLPFATDALSRPDFIYDTEPACRAVVAARMFAPTAALAVLHAIQHGFYAKAQDVTQGKVLADIASVALTQAGVPVDPAKFLETWASAAAVEATRADFLQTQRWEISGFPTLVLERDGQLDLVTAGYLPMPKLVEAMQSLIDDDADRTAGGAAS